MDCKIFEKELSYIVTEEIRNLALTGLENLPNYFYSMPASTTGKYHPSYALGDGGLVRHTKAAALFAHYICELEQTKNDFTQEERDCMIAGLLLHDGWKEGNGGSSFTVHEHPQICADWIRTSDIFSDYDNKYREMISSVIESHMGEWNENKRSSVILKKPKTSMQKLVHLCDYLASRKNIEIIFDGSEAAEKPDINTYIFPFKKHKGKLLVDVAKEDPDYLRWCYNNLTMKEPLKGFIKDLLENK